MLRIVCAISGLLSSAVESTWCLGPLVGSACGLKEARWVGLGDPICRRPVTRRRRDQDHCPGPTPGELQRGWDPDRRRPGHHAEGQPILGPHGLSGRELRRGQRFVQQPEEDERDGARWRRGGGRQRYLRHRHSAVHGHEAVGRRGRCPRRNRVLRERVRDLHCCA